MKTNRSKRISKYKAQRLGREMLNKVFSETERKKISDIHSGMNTYTDSKNRILVESRGVGYIWESYDEIRRFLDDMENRQPVRFPSDFYQVSEGLIHDFDKFICNMLGENEGGVRSEMPDDPMDKMELLDKMVQRERLILQDMQTDDVIISFVAWLGEHIRAKQPGWQWCWLTSPNNMDVQVPGLRKPDGCVISIFDWATGTILDYNRYEHTFCALLMQLESGYLVKKQRG